MAAINHPLLGRLAEAWPRSAWRDVTVIVAVSGGCDSVALLRALLELRAADETPGRGALLAAHFNHRLRGEASDADQAFVEQLCRGLDVGCVTGAAQCATGDVASDASEASARTARYAFLREVAQRRGARYVATAHTADDQVETVLHRVIRGTGVAGLTGIPKARPLGHSATLIRPLLNVRRQELQSYLAELNQEFREDASNRMLRYTRNRLRNELLPHLREAYNPGIDAALLRLSQQAAEAQEQVQRDAQALVDRAGSASEDGSAEFAVLDCTVLAASEAHLVRESLKIVWRELGWPEGEMGFTEWQRIAALTRGTATEAKFTLPGNVTVERCGKRLHIIRQPRR